MVQQSNNPLAGMENRGERLLILGGSTLQVPAIIEAKKLGLTVAVLDYDANCPGRALADRFFLESTRDKEAVLRSARAFSPGGIITLGTDLPMRSVAFASEALGLHSISYEAARKATNKYKMIQAFAQGGVPHPFYLYFDPASDRLENILEKVPLPCVVKPLDSSASRGVIYVDDLGDLERAVAYSKTYSSNGDVIIEEYLEGPEVSVEIIILRGVPHVLAITDKETTGFPHFVETMHTQPSRLSSEDQAAIMRLSVLSCQALGLDSGTAHAEFIVTGSGPKIVEVGPRMGGDYITTHLVPLSTGINMTRLLIEEALGQDPKLPEMIPGGASVRYLMVKTGILKGVENLDEIQRDPGVVEAGLFFSLGDEVPVIRSSQDRLGYIITRGASAEEAAAKGFKAQSKLKIIME